MNNRPWCILADVLPIDVDIDGHRHAVDTRTSTAVCCLRRLRDDLPDELAMAYVFKRLGLPPATASKQAAIWFLNGPQTGHQSKQGGPAVFDYFQDASLIVAAFRQSYGMSLQETLDLHWWEFLALLQGLPGDTRLSEVMDIRSMPIDPKEPHDVQARKRRAKRSVALQDSKSAEEQLQDTLSSLL